MLELFFKVGKYGTLQRTVGNKKDRDRDRKREESESDEEPKRKIKERKSRTLYKNALNGKYKFLIKLRIKNRVI